VSVAAGEFFDEENALEPLFDRDSWDTHYWGEGELPPGTQGVFPVWFSCPDAKIREAYFVPPSCPIPKIGDTLVFPVQVVLKDSSVVRWDGPPGSERPAPLLVVRRARRVGTKTGLVIVVFALIPLLAAGAWKARRQVRPER